MLRLPSRSHQLRLFSTRPLFYRQTSAGLMVEPQVQSELETGEVIDGVPDVRRSKFQSVPMSPPSSPGTNVFPEEAFQGFTMDDFPGLSVEPFTDQVAQTLHAPLATEDVEIKPDGALFLPEVKYRKTLNQAFGPGGWSLIPRGPHTMNGATLSREYALFCRGRFVSQARGAATVQGVATPASSTEAVRSNALMRCCKDLGVASELWDQHFVESWKGRFACRKTITDRYGNGKVIYTRKQP